MSLGHSYSRAQLGITAPLVSVETALSGGLPGIHIIGMAQTAVKEASDRVRSAFGNNGLAFPRGKVTVHLAPADLPKHGSGYDLAIALSILAAQNHLDQQVLDQYEVLGELGLDGCLRPIKGVLPAVLGNRNTNRQLIIPKGNGQEAGLCPEAEVLLADALASVLAHLEQQTSLPLAERSLDEDHASTEKLSDVRGQQPAKRALTIAAAGGHNLLFIGPPGTGKSMLASRLPMLLPAMTTSEALETASLHSICSPISDPRWFYRRPFRTPHHTASTVALVGGGSTPLPGEISLAHHGVLFLDELPEFSRTALEALREPLESRRVTISRARYQVQYPARFQLVAAMNPCPCGYYGDSRCDCSLDQIRRYRSRVSGPLADRIDLHVSVLAQSASMLNTEPDLSEDRETINQVTSAQREMLERRGKPNAMLNATETLHDCRLSLGDQRLLEKAIDSLNLSARAYFKVLKIARTIADMSGRGAISRPDILEAISYRQLDRSSGEN